MPSAKDGTLTGQNAEGRDAEEVPNKGKQEELQAGRGLPTGGGHGMGQKDLGEGYVHMAAGQYQIQYRHTLVIITGPAAWVSPQGGPQGGKVGDGHLPQQAPVTHASVWRLSVHPRQLH